MRVPDLLWGIHTTTHPPSPTSLMSSIGARRSWRCHLPTLGQLRSVPPRSFRLSGSSVSSRYNATLRCRRGKEYRSSLKWGANNSGDPSCFPTPGGQRGPDRALIHGHAGTYPLHIPASPLSALPQPRPRAQPTLPCSLSIAPPQVCPAGRQGSRLRPTPALPLPWAGHVPERRPQATCPAPPLCRPSPVPPAAWGR